MEIIRYGLSRQALISAAFPLLSPLGWAEESQAPVAIPSMTGTATINSTLTGNSGFSDDDSDLESGTTYAWIGEGALGDMGSAQTLTVTAASGVSTITLTVTPKINAAITGAAKSVKIAIQASLGAFLTPDTAARTWTVAEAYCKAKVPRARLPTKAELKHLFLSATSARVAGEFNTEMCKVHNWPLGGHCGGSKLNYWSSTPNGYGAHFSVSLISGIAYPNADGDPLQVACVQALIAVDRGQNGAHRPASNCTVRASGCAQLPRSGG